jgi:uncharacterized membrane protein
MKRIKGIDTIRGLAIFFMCLHITEWWLRPKDIGVFIIVVGLVGELSASGLLFISGVSAIILFRSRIAKVKSSHNYNINQVKNEYLFRALIILVIALIFNTIIALGELSLLNIWTWFIPLTMALSLLLAYPLLKSSKIFRILLAIILWIMHYFLYSLLLPYEGQANFMGVLFHIFYNSRNLHPLIYYFSFFLIGTVIGDVLFEIYHNNIQNEKRMIMKKKLLLPSLIIGPILLLFGLLFVFPGFLNHMSISSTVYTLGFMLTLLSLMVFYEEFKVKTKKKNYRFFFFYSYYSLTVFFGHYLLYFVFTGLLDNVTIWIAAVVTFTLLTLLIRFMYKKYGAKLALKVYIGRLAGELARRVEVKKKINQN